MKHYQVVGFEDASPVFWFTVLVLSEIEIAKTFSLRSNWTEMV